MSEAANPATEPAASPFEAALAILDRDEAGGEGADNATSASETDPASAGADTPTPGDENEAPEPEERPEEQPHTYRVKVRGQEVDVTLEELRNGYSRTEDYKAKTAEVAQQRRDAEAAKTEFTARAQRLDQLMAMAPHDPVLAEAAKTDWVKLAQEDPARFVELRAQAEERQKFWGEVQEQRQTAQQQAFTRQVEAAHADLSESLPEWRDEGKRKELTEKVGKMLADTGYSQQEISTLADPRAMKLLVKAHRWDQHEAQRKAIEAKRAPPAPTRTLRPGSSQEGQAPANTRALLNKARTATSMDARVDAVMAILGD